MLRFKTVCQKWETENQKRELKKQRGILFCTLQAICPWVEADLVGAAKSSNRGQKPLELRLTWTKERRGGSGCGGVAGTALCPLCPANQSTLDQRDRAGFAAAGWSCMVCYLSVSLTVWLSVSPDWLWHRCHKAHTLSSTRVTDWRGIRRTGITSGKAAHRCCCCCYCNWRVAWSAINPVNESESVLRAGQCKGNWPKCEANRCLGCCVNLHLNSNTKHA